MDGWWRRKVTGEAWLCSRVEKCYLLSVHCVWHHEMPGWNRRASRCGLLSSGDWQASKERQSTDLFNLISAKNTSGGWCVSITARWHLKRGREEASLRKWCSSGWQFHIPHGSAFGEWTPWPCWHGHLGPHGNFLLLCVSSVTWLLESAHANGSHLCVLKVYWLQPKVGTEPPPLK